jgi:ADP-L-glycero-D-manno-heptose 6-epimerase
MIILTGAAGFIGSHLTTHFGKKHRLMLVDKPEYFRERGYYKDEENTLHNWAHGTADTQESRHKIVDREYFPKVLQSIHAAAPANDPKAKEHVLIPAGEKIDLVIHIGACTNTGEFRKDFLDKWNVEYSKTIWNWCVQEKVPLIYASSAATYGNGEEGFSDSWETALKLKPMNPYGQSKQDFDLWVYEQIQKNKTPPHWYGLKFFNVYGPHEAHKGRMASAVLHSYRSIASTGACPLFRSHNPKVKDGEQSRDFIHVQDIVSIIQFLADKKPKSQLYNCGTGHARTFYSMVENLFASMEKPLQVNWMETPEQFRKAYQYFTEAKMERLKEAGYSQDFLSLERGVADYASWLKTNDPVAPKNPKDFQ